MVSSIQENVRWLVRKSLFMGTIAAGMNYSGTAQKIMGKAAPSFVDAMKYGFVKSIVDLGVITWLNWVTKAAESHFDDNSMEDDLAKTAAKSAAIAVLYFSAPSVSWATKNILRGNVHDRFQYLTYLWEMESFYLAQI